jgi:2-succinyl-5-enolpyruvyl-6-hydroxy-3-cyclohexene-1-carboxylate synthase
MNKNFTSQRNVQIVIALLKANGVKKIVTSPGMTDVAINISLQHDPYFKLYSCVDERSAAYMACGMAAETGECVGLTCTGATSSRNYMPGLTEAYYRHLPILAITCSQTNSRIGHYMNQVTDRTLLPRDVANVSVTAQLVTSANDEWDVVNKVNEAIIGLRRNGGGPCHINLEMGSNATDFSAKEIPAVRVVKQYGYADFKEWPDITDKKVAVFVGQHGPWSNELTSEVDVFCERYNAFVIADNTSNYQGKYKIQGTLLLDQAEYQFGDTPFDIDLLIHIGYVSHVIGVKARKVWRVNEDGVLRDTFQKITGVFGTDELTFFKHYTEGDSAKKSTTQYSHYKRIYDSLLAQVPELPFSNLWIASQIMDKIPTGSSLHLGIRNSLRSYDYIAAPSNITIFSNTGGFGIDGGVSSLIGASMTNPSKLYFGVFGDLLFFYDMNSIGNRDVKSNVRIMIVNNGLGQEFKNYSCGAAKFGEETDIYVAARGHFGHKSPILVKSYAEALGFKYITASNKEEFKNVVSEFLDPKIGERPVIFEVFTNTEDESEALKLVTALSQKSKMLIKAKTILQNEHLSTIKNVVKSIIKK